VHHVGNYCIVNYKDVRLVAFLTSKLDVNWIYLSLKRICCPVSKVDQNKNKNKLSLKISSSA